MWQVSGIVYVIVFVIAFVFVFVIVIVFFWSGYVPSSLLSHVLRVTSLSEYCMEVYFKSV